MTTAVVQIGNSDDKLTQQEWSDYWANVDEEIHGMTEEIHFSAGSSTINPWQNYCWVFALKESDVPVLRNRLAAVREKYRQDSVAMTTGETAFV